MTRLLTESGARVPARLKTVVAVQQRSTCDERRWTQSFPRTRRRPPAPPPTYRKPGPVAGRWPPAGRDVDGEVGVPRSIVRIRARWPAGRSDRNVSRTLPRYAARNAPFAGLLEPGGARMRRLRLRSSITVL